MRIAIGNKLKSGPWGGGNNFVQNLSDYLKEKNCEVFFDLKNKNLDIILLTDPRFQSQTSSFNHIDIFKYIKNINSNTLVVHRINECDERKSTTGVNDQIIHSNIFTDYTVFISTWLSELFIKLKKFENYKVICNGANNKIFFNKKRNINLKKKIKLVTHHWSNHINKGFDIYKLIDDKLDCDSSFRDKFEFSIIGNIPKNLNLKKTAHIKPLSGIELAESIRQNDIYITGSKFEPGGNHQNEAINCGLPILYLNSGCMNEYCKGYGLEYTFENIFYQLDEIVKHYDTFSKNTLNYNLNSDFTCSNYYELFKNLLVNKKKYIQKRNWPNISIIDLMKRKIERLLI